MAAAAGADGGGGGRGVILQHGDYIYLTGTGASPGGDRPFLDRLDLKTLKTERLFRCAEKTYESVIAPLDDEAKTLLTEYETPADPPNYYVRNLAAGTKRAITQFKDPAPQLAGVAETVRHLPAKGRREAFGHAVPAARLQEGRAAAAC